MGLGRVAIAILKDKFNLSLVTSSGLQSNFRDYERCGDVVTSGPETTGIKCRERWWKSTIERDRDVTVYTRNQHKSKARCKPRGNFAIARRLIPQWAR